MNALVVQGGHRLSAEAMKALEAASSVIKTPDGATMWAWETNIAPFWGRTGAFDLREEVAIFEGVTRLPAAAYRWVRAGDDPGGKGELLDHPLFREVGFTSVSEAMEEELARETLGPQEKPQASA